MASFLDQLDEVLGAGLSSGYTNVVCNRENNVILTRSAPGGDEERGLPAPHATWAAHEVEPAPAGRPQVPPRSHVEEGKVRPGSEARWPGPPPGVPGSDARSRHEEAGDMAGQDGPDPAVRRTRPQPRGLPPATALTWCRAQLFRNRTRQGKSAWTLKLCAATCSAERINPRRPEVTVYVDLMRPSAFRSSVGRMAAKGTLTPEQVAAYEAAAQDIERMGEAEPGRVALLGHVGVKAQGLGTMRFPGQFASLLIPPGPDAGPVCLVEVDEESILIEEFHRLDGEGHDRDPRAARWVGYHDAAGYNEHRKARHDRG